MIPADDDMVKQLNTDALQRRANGFGRLRVRNGWRWIAGRVVVDEQNAMRAPKERRLRYIARVDLRLAERSADDTLATLHHFFCV